jgi:hypothetical protein
MTGSRHELDDFVYDSIQYSHFSVDLNDGRHEDVKLHYDDTEYRIEIQDGKPVVVDE